MRKGQVLFQECNDSHFSIGKPTDPVTDDTMTQIVCWSDKKLTTIRQIRVSTCQQKNITTRQKTDQMGHVEEKIVAA